MSWQDSFTHELKVTLPFNANLSKNRAARIGGRGAKRWIILSQEYRDAIEEIVTLLKPHADKLTWEPKKKVYMYIIVMRPHFRSDIINFIDGLADAIKKCIPVDDRYYAIETCDWFLDKENPRIELCLHQEK